MTTIPDWMIHFGEGLTVADYEALSEEVCRQIEIVDGNIVISPRPPRAHQHVAGSLITTIKEAAEPGFAAVGGVDLRLRDAASGIRHFWRIEYDDGAVSAYRYQLDPMTRTYALVGLDKEKLTTKDPIVLEVRLEALR